jgi:hypothetical protein
MSDARWNQYWNWVVRGLGGLVNMVEQLCEQSPPNHPHTTADMRDYANRILKASGQRYIMDADGWVTDTQTTCQRQFDPSNLFNGESQ